MPLSSQIPDSRGDVFDGHARGWRCRRLGLVRSLELADPWVQHRPRDPNIRHDVVVDFPGDVTGHLETVGGGELGELGRYRDIAQSGLVAHRDDPRRKPGLAFDNQGEALPIRGDQVHGVLAARPTRVLQPGILGASGTQKADGVMVELGAKSPCRQRVKAMCLSLLHVERHVLVIAHNDAKWIRPSSQEGRCADRLFSPSPVGKVDRPPVLADLPFQELALQCPVLAEGEDLAGALDGEGLGRPDPGHATQGRGRFLDDAHFRRRRAGAANNQRHRKGEQNTDRRHAAPLRLSDRSD